ncbi:MAG: geranylgeranyl diphosphate synthase, type [Verrucomicrobiota bacterium]
MHRAVAQFEAESQGDLAETRVKIADPFLETLRLKTAHVAHQDGMEQLADGLTLLLRIIMHRHGPNKPAGGMPHPASYFPLKRLDFESLRHKRFFRSAAAAEWPHSRPVNIGRYLKSRQKTVDRALDGYLPKANVKPATIHKAMRYSLFAGGKRLRPILCLAAAEACGGKIANALPFACAFECIHTYSLVHDDLPSMDNDDFRRGRPTCHKVFGEGIAVLAGDALLTIAFEIVSRAAPTKRYSMATFLRETAVAAGSRRLIAGQVADLEAEGKRVTRAELRYVHENKTAAILSTSVRLGAMSANATTRQLAALTRFGRALGLAFQVIDDILDVTQTSEKLGKSAGKDIAAKKATYPAIIGLEASRVEARRLTKQAHNALTLFGAEADALHALANYLLEREY